MGIPPAGVRDDRGVTAGGGDLHLPTLEHGCTVYFYQDQYGPVSGGGEDTGSKDGQSVVGTGWGGCGGYLDDGLVCETDGGGGGDGWDVDRYRLLPGL